VVLIYIRDNHQTGLTKEQRERHMRTTGGEGGVCAAGCWHLAVLGAGAGCCKLHVHRGGGASLRRACPEPLFQVQCTVPWQLTTNQQGKWVTRDENRAPVSHPGTGGGGSAAT
jgi:hypothetical protein